ncbi:serine/threonine protein kinase [Sorangium sp. So ce233]|uniref:serine/threonine protein kinase n=1 Tax=Sorangium sp. So ce233 TaxID=3133290 RepID=UPI003F610464
MVAAGDVWEGHELLNEERGLLRHFLARQVGDTGALVWLHVHEGTCLDAGLFAEEIARLQRLSAEVPEVVPVLYGGVNGAVAWAASPVLGDAIPLIDATRGNDVGPADLEVLIDVGRCLARAHELSFIHGALSPDRVFLGGDGRYAITHFGFARLFQLGPEDARQDPYGYAPPELFSGGRLGPRADVYGFGTIMYELLCKRALSPWARPPSFPSGIPPMLQVMMQRALEENPNRRQPSIDKMLSVLTPFARAWEELGVPPAPPPADSFAGPSGARHKPDEAASIRVEDEASAFASGEEGGRAGEFPTPRPSEVPDTVKSVPPRDAADSVTEASPVGTWRPSETPSTLKSAIPPRDARDDVAHAPPVAMRSAPAPELPDLEPMLPVPPVPSTPPRSPVLPAPPVPSTPPRSSRTSGRHSPPRWFAAVLALAFVLGSAAAVLRWEPPRHAVPRLAPVVQAAAGRATPPPSARPLDRCPEPLAGAAAPPDAAPPRVVPRSPTNRPAAPTRQARKTPAQEPDLCDGLVPCQKVFY